MLEDDCINCERVTVHSFIENIVMDDYLAINRYKCIGCGNERTYEKHYNGLMEEVKS